VSPPRPLGWARAAAACPAETARLARAVAWVAVGAAVLALGGCAIGGERSAHLIDRSQVPAGLLTPAPQTTSLHGSAARGNVTLYFDSSGELVAVDRSTAVPVTLERVLRLLARGPSPSEQAAGVESPLSTAHPIALRSMVGDTATVDVASTFAAIGGRDQIVAVAQLVYTVTAFPGVDAVTVLVGGQRTAVPTASGSLSEGPLRREQYAALAPR